MLELSKPCWFHLLTGLNCPLCGGQRMVMALLRGNICEAFHHNPLVCGMLMVAVGLAIVGTASKKARQRMRPLWSGRAIMGYIILLILWGIVRNIMGI